MSEDVYVVPTLAVARDLGARQRGGVLRMSGGYGDRVVSVRQHPASVYGMRVGEITLHHGVSRDEAVVDALEYARQKARKKT